MASTFIATVACVTFVAGTLLIRRGYRNPRGIFPSHDWNVVRGEVRWSKLDEEEVYDCYPGMPGGWTTERYPVVNYEYCVGGEWHASTVVRLSGTRVSDLKRYEKGRVVDVFVHPADPTLSFLEPPTSSPALLHSKEPSDRSIAYGLVCLLVAVGLFVAAM